MIGEAITAPIVGANQADGVTLWRATAHRDDADSQAYGPIRTRPDALRVPTDQKAGVRVPPTAPAKHQVTLARERTFPATLTHSANSSKGGAMPQYAIIGDHTPLTCPGASKSAAKHAEDA
jgi:hypothetical protein